MLEYWWIIKSYPLTFMFMGGFIYHQKILTIKQRCFVGILEKYLIICIKRSLIMDNKKILVFLSRPNPFIDSQQQFIEQLQKRFEKYDIVTVTLQADNYDLTDSINYLKGMIKQCYGIVIVGFKQIYIDKGSKKRGGKSNPNYFHSEEIDISGQALTSPFCHIEGTIGLLNDLPLLIINEGGIREEGIVKGGKFCTKTKKFDLSKIDDFFSDKTIDQQIAVWAGKVTEYYLFLNLKKV